MDNGKGKNMKKAILIMVTTGILMGCGFNRKNEIPSNDATGSDMMKPSPCACVNLKYEAPQLKFRG